MRYLTAMAIILFTAILAFGFTTSRTFSPDYNDLDKTVWNDAAAGNFVDVCVTGTAEVNSLILPVETYSENLSVDCNLNRKTYYIINDVNVVFGEFGLGNACNFFIRDVNSVVFHPPSGANFIRNGTVLDVNNTVSVTDCDFISVIFNGLSATEAFLSEEN